MADRDGATHLITDITVEKELEVSFVRRGSNPKSKVILKKSADTQPPTENTDMLKSVAIAKALAAGGALAAYVESLTKEEDLDAFLAKDEAGQTADVAAFAKAKNMPFGEDTKAAPAKKADEAIEGEAGADALAKAVEAAVAKAVEPLQKALEEANGRVEELQGGVVKATLEKRAATEFKGLGKSAAETVSILKAVDAIGDADARAAITDILKAHAELTGKIAGSIGLRELGKNANSATARLQKAIDDHAQKAGVSKEEAEIAISENPDFSDLLAQVDAEEAEARAA